MILRIPEIIVEIPGNNLQRVINSFFIWERSHCADYRHKSFFNASCYFDQRTPSRSRVNLQLFLRKKQELDDSAL